MFEFIENKTFWITALIAAVYVYLKYWVYNYWKQHGIPQEAPSIPLGNITPSYILGKISLGNLFKESYQKFQNHPFHGFYIFYKPILIVNDPALIRLILAQEFARFADRGWFVNENVDPLSGNLFLMREEKCSRLRRKFSPTFTPGNLKLMYSLFMEVSNEMISICDAEIKHSNILDMKDIIARYTTDIISSVVFGFNCDSLKNPNTDFRRLGMKAFDFGRITILLGVFFPELLENITIPLYSKDIREFFINTFKDTVEYRRKEGIVRHDFMNLLMQLVDKGHLEVDEKTSDQESKNDDDCLTMMEATTQAFSFFVAGFETSSTIATYCLVALAMNPDVQIKLQQEIDEVAESSNGFKYDSIMEMEYLDMVISETMRTLTAVPFLNRICLEDFPVPNSNYTIPKGMRILIPSSGVHCNSKIFPDPDKFDPLRFSKEKRTARSIFTSLGFGAGPRMCTGKRFGLLQVKQALVALLYNYNFFISSKTKLPIQYTTESFLHMPEGSVYLRIERRRKCI